MTSTPTILVAGSTGAIGRQISASLAKRGAKVVLLGRNEASLTQLSQSLDGDTETLVVDFSDLDSVRKAANEAQSRFKDINGIALSAANFFPEDEPHILPTGHEAMFITNFLGPFELIQQLLPRLKESKSSIIVNVIAPTSESLDFEDIESISMKPFEPIKAFARSKQCNIAIVGELSRRLAGDDVSSIGYNPGFVKNETAKKVPGFMGVVMRFASWMFGTDGQEAGEGIATLMLSADRASFNGKLYSVPVKEEDAMPAMHDEELGAKVWEKAMELLQK